MGTKSDESEINISEVLSYLIHYLPIIILTACLCAALGYCISRFMLMEEFQSSCEIYVLEKQDDDNTTYSDMQASSQLVSDYQELITTRYVLTTVIDDLRLEMNYDELKDMISVTSPTGTHIIKITVTNTDPHLAQKICADVMKTASKHIKTVMDIDAVNIVDEANLPKEKSAPSYARWTVLLGTVGALMACVYLIIRFVIDDTIKTNEDVTRYLGYAVLGIIPSDEAIIENSLGRDNRKKRKKKIRT